MALENLYQCTWEECENLPNQMADIFFHDVLFEAMFPKEATRKTCLRLFFSEYLKAFGPDSMILADSADRNAYMVIYDKRSTHQPSYFKRMCRMNAKLIRLLPKMGGRNFLHLLKNWDLLSHHWVKSFERDPYLHLDFIFTNDQMRHQGIAKQMVRELVDEGDIMDMDVCVHTFQKQRAVWYEQLGFVLMNTIVDEESGFSQYCLIARHEKERTSWIQSIE